jgi:hypothetical protein
MISLSDILPDRWTVIASQYLLPSDETAWHFGINEWERSNINRLREHGYLITTQKRFDDGVYRLLARRTKESPPLRDAIEEIERKSRRVTPPRCDHRQETGTKGGK